MPIKPKKPTKKRAKRTERVMLAWAVIDRDTGQLLKSLSGQRAVWGRKSDAVADRPYYGRVALVSITEVKARKGGAG